MKNVTITLDAQALAWARVRAAEAGKSLSRYVGDILQGQMRQSRRYEEAMKAALAQQPVRFEGRRLSREELYALPRHLR